MKLSAHERQVPGTNIRTRITDRAAGIVFPAHPEFSQRLADMQQDTGAAIVFAPALGMKTHVADMRKGNEPLKLAAPGFVRTQNVADAAIIDRASLQMFGTQQRVALLMMVADSPGIVVHDPATGALALANGSQQCLVPDDGSESIVTKLIAQLRATGSNPSDIRMAVSACVQACCYGHALGNGDPKNALLQSRLLRWGNDIVQPSVLYPPRTGNGIDLSLLARRQAEAEGVLPEHIDVDTLCTSHDGLDTTTLAADVAAGAVMQGRFYSGVRGARMGDKQTPKVAWNERGALLAWEQA